MEFIVEGRKFTDYNEAVNYENKLREEEEAKRRAEEERARELADKKAKTLSAYKRFLEEHLTLFELSEYGKKRKRYIAIITDSTEPFKFACALVEQKLGRKYTIVRDDSGKTDVRTNWVVKLVKDSDMISSVIHSITYKESTDLDLFVYQSIPYTNIEDFEYVPCGCKLQDNPYYLFPDDLVKAFLSL